MSKPAAGRTKTRQIVNMNPEAVRAIASKWFLIGFHVSGAGFHGETYPPEMLEKYPDLKSLLLTFFDLRWNE